MKFKYGVSQGRLSSIIGYKIHEFPEKYWQSEIVKAKKLDFKSIKWTLDYKNLKNPKKIKLYFKENVLINKFGLTKYLFKIFKLLSENDSKFIAGSIFKKDGEQTNCI